MTTAIGLMLALAAFRLTRLVGWDEITQGPRSKVSGMSDRQYAVLAKAVEDALHNGLDPWNADGVEMPVSPTRYYWAKMLHCPWCVGWWISLAVALAWWAWPIPVEYASFPLALSALVGLTAKNLDP